MDGGVLSLKIHSALAGKKALSMKIASDFYWTR